MTRSAKALRLVSKADAPPTERVNAGSDFYLLAFIFLVTLVPIAGQLARGNWGQGTVGIATAVALLSGRELLLEIRAHLRSR